MGTLENDKLEIALMEILVDFNYKKIGFEVAKNQIMAIFNGDEKPIEIEPPTDEDDEDVDDFKIWWYKLQNKKK